MWRIVSLSLLLVAFTLPADAKSNKAKHVKSPDRPGSRQEQAERRDKFSAAERNLIRAELLNRERQQAQRSARELPPGLQKKQARGKPLPPGWQKKLEPGHSLDYQVYRRGETLPDTLQRRLPPSPVGSEILRVEDKIIRLNSATRTILDVFDLTP